MEAMNDPATGATVRGPADWLGVDMTQTIRRAKGSGSLSFKAGRWRYVLALPKDGSRRRRRLEVRRPLFCQALKEISELATRPAGGPRGAAMLDAARTLGTHTEGEWWALVRAGGRICAYCGREAGGWRLPPNHPLALQMDHKIPLSRGGSDSIDNIAISCRGCNAEKGMMTADEYLQWKAAR